MLKLMRASMQPEIMFVLFMHRVLFFMRLCPCAEIYARADVRLELKAHLCTHVNSIESVIKLRSSIRSAELDLASCSRFRVVTSRNNLAKTLLYMHNI